jgi:hypothetical protein
LERELSGAGKVISKLNNSEVVYYQPAETLVEHMIKTREDRNKLKTSAVDEKKAYRESHNKNA